MWQVDTALSADFVPSGSAFALRWSPWHVTEASRTALLAYIAKNHVGFRRVTIHGEWKLGDDPTVQVEEVDVASICTFLATDASVEWEDAVSAMLCPSIIQFA